MVNLGEKATLVVFKEYVRERMFKIIFSGERGIVPVHMNTNAMTQDTVHDVDITFSAQTSCVTWTCRVT